MTLNHLSLASLIAAVMLLLAGCGQINTSQTEAQPNPPSKALAATPGTVMAWGAFSQTNLPAGLSSATAISAGQGHSLALTPGGTVVAWGCGSAASNFGQCNVPSGLTGVTAIAAGWGHSLALKSDSSVVAWGCSGVRNYGQCTIPSGLTGVTAIVAASFHSMALKNDGTVVVWGCNGPVNSVDFGQCNLPSGLTGVTAIAASWYHSLALKSGGTVVAWGCGIQDVGQCTVPSGLTGVTAIAAGINHSLALKSDGTVVAWGCRFGFAAGQCTVPTDLTGVMAISAGDSHNMALKSGGTVVAWGCGGSYNFGQCTVPSGLTGVMAISAGQEHSMALVEVPTDTTAPTANPTGSPAANSAGWNNSDVNVNWNWADEPGGSGIDTTNCLSSSTSSGEGTLTLNATCKDKAGNKGSAEYTVKVDKTKPTLSAAPTTSPNTDGWYNSNVSVHFTCADTLSGIASCPSDQNLSSEGDGVSSTAQTATDKAGNTSEPSNVLTVKIDKTAPVVSINGVSNGAVYTLGSVPAASCSTSDALSGVATQATLSISGGTAAGTGSFSFTCSGALDIAGNGGSASVSYQVNYNFRGFFQPIDNLPALNQVKAGSSIPVKFSLSGNQGLNIFAANFPSSQPLSCSSSAPIDEIEQTVTASNSSLTYDAATDTYTYVWKTDKAWSNTCRQLSLTLVDGQTYKANFKFK